MTTKKELLYRIDFLEQKSEWLSEKIDSLADKNGVAFLFMEKPKRYKIVETKTGENEQV